MKELNPNHPEPEKVDEVVDVVPIKKQEKFIGSLRDVGLPVWEFEIATGEIRKAELENSAYLSPAPDAQTQKLMKNGFDFLSGKRKPKSEFDFEKQRRVSKEQYIPPVIHSQTFKGKPVIKHKIIQKKGCLYQQALNMKNAQKHFKKMIRGLVGNYGILATDQEWNSLTFDQSVKLLHKLMKA